MDLTLAPADAAFAEQVRGWLARHMDRPGRFDSIDDEVAWGRRWQATMAADRMVAIYWPESVGGRGATPVETSYGGGFVSEMLDRSSDPSRRRDWFYWVDGALADVGARHRDLGEGEEAWWDYRDWGQLTDIWAVVGQWPAPFVSAGSPDRGVFADEPLRAELVAEGATISSDPRAPFRVRVGSNEALVASDPAWERASADPDGAGLAVAIDDGQIVALGPNGEKRSPVPGARALAAAVPSELEPRRGILMVVAGLDQEAAEAAAETIADRPEALRLRFAVAFDREGDPITGSGAST